MAYVDRSTGNNRVYVLTAVAALHGAALYALVTGLGVEYVKETIAVIQGVNIPVEQPKMDPPPPQPENKAKPEETKIVAPKPQIDVAPVDNRQINTVPTPLPLPSFPPAPEPAPNIEPAPPPSPAPSFAARGVRAIGKPGNWVTTNDYPSRDLREGNQGRTGFALSIGADGKVQSCRITSSSGFAGLDDATCANMKRRARFEPARDGQGNPTTGTYISTVSWQIPQ